jgi:hypothetical protein
VGTAVINPIEVKPEMNDTQNPFERAKIRTTLADDRKTRFDRNDAARAKRLSDTTERDARVKRNAQQRSAWSGDARAGGTRTMSVLLDPATAKLKTAADAERKVQPVAPPVLPSGMTIAAIILEWERNNPNYHRSEFNAENMKNFLLTNIAAGTLDWSYEALDATYQWLRENNYLEDAPRPRKRGEFATTSAPKIYAPFLSGEARAAEGDRQRIEQARLIEKDVERALSVPFDQLQKQVRASLSRYGAEAVR